MVRETRQEGRVLRRESNEWVMEVGKKLFVSKVEVLGKGLWMVTNGMDARVSEIMIGQLGNGRMDAGQGCEEGVVGEK